MRRFNIAYVRLKNVLRAVRITLFVLIITYVLIVAAVASIHVNFKAFNGLGSWLGAKGVLLSPFTHEQAREEAIREEQRWVEQGALQEWAKLKKIVKYSLAIFFLLPIIIFLLISEKDEEEERHKRGGQQTAETREKKLLKKEGKGSIPLGRSLILPRKYENQHVLVMGQTGTGKTTFLLKAMEKVRQLGERAIIHDLKGDYLSRFYQPGDIIFCPFDKRSINWNILNEINKVYEVDSFCDSLIPDPEGNKDPFWERCAKLITGGCLEYLKRNKPGAATKDFIRMLNLPFPELQKLLDGTEAGNQLRIEKTALGVLMTLSTYLQGFKFIRGDLGDFSFKRWTREGKGWLFLLNIPKLEAALAGPLALVVDMIATELISMPDDPSRRLFFFLDEFGYLRKMPSLMNLFSLSRSKGGSVWLGSQDFGRIKKRYGKDETESIANTFSTKAVFRLGDPEAAKYFERAFGEVEVEKDTENYSTGQKDVRDGISYGRTTERKPLVMASEIMNLPNYTFYLKLGNLPLTVSGVDPVTLPKHTEEFIEAEEMDFKVEIQSKPAKNEDSLL